MKLGSNLQLPLTPKAKQLQRLYGHVGIEAIHGGGCLSEPNMMLVFMNPTARNLASTPGWSGIRAPWIGVNKIWILLANLGLINSEVVPEKWDEATASELYSHLAEQKLYITNLASCTQPDARPLPNSVFREYMPLFYEEVIALRPKKIVTFGNQVSSVLLGRSISVSSYRNTMVETLDIGDNTYFVYPTYYPVGQGQRNMAQAMSRIEAIMRE